eukprot:scaffold56445_cov60-Phaeocystis_antarctica.AAC.5
MSHGSRPHNDRPGVRPSTLSSNFRPLLAGVFLRYRRPAPLRGGDMLTASSIDDRLPLLPPEELTSAASQVSMVHKTTTLGDRSAGFAPASTLSPHAAARSAARMPARLSGHRARALRRCQARALGSRYLVNTTLLLEPQSHPYAHTQLAWLFEPFKLVGHSRAGLDLRQLGVCLARILARLASDRPRRKVGLVESVHPPLELGGGLPWPRLLVLGASSPPEGGFDGELAHLGKLTDRGLHRRQAVARPSNAATAAQNLPGLLKLLFEADAARRSPCSDVLPFVLLRLPRAPRLPAHLTSRNVPRPLVVRRVVAQPLQAARVCADGWLRERPIGLVDPNEALIGAPRVNRENKPVALTVGKGIAQRNRCRAKKWPHLQNEQWR